VVAYTFQVGGSTSWKAGDTNALAFTIKRNKDDSTTFSHFTGGKVLVDGKAIAASNYTTAAGSLKLELLPAYLETLAPGTHTLEVVFDDGTAKGSFSVSGTGGASGTSNASSGTAGTGTGGATSPTDPNGGPEKQAAEFPWIPILLGIIALLLLAIIILLLTRRRNDRINTQQPNYPGGQGGQGSPYYR